MSISNWTAGRNLLRQVIFGRHHPRWGRVASAQESPGALRHSPSARTGVLRRPVARGDEPRSTKSLNALRATLVAAALLVAAIAGSGPAHAAGACALVPNAHTPSERILECGGAEALTVRAAQGTRYRPLYKKGDPLPVGIRLDGGALLIQFHPTSARENFQILTPLAIAAVRGTKWAVDVARARTSVLVLSGAVAVTNRRLNQYVILTEGEGVDITPADTSMVQKRWGEARIRALLARFGE